MRCNKMTIVSWYYISKLCVLALIQGLALKSTGIFIFKRWGHYTNKFLLKEMYSFSFAKNTQFFTLIVQRVFFFFCYCVLFLVFALIFIQIFLYLFIKVYFCLWTILVFIKRVELKKFEWCWKREKDLCKKVVQKGACLDCGLDFCMSCLMSFW
jgi:hypothetical protein